MPTFHWRISFRLEASHGIASRPLLFRSLIYLHRWHAGSCNTLPVVCPCLEGNDLSHTLHAQCDEIHVGQFTRDSVLTRSRLYYQHISKQPRSSRIAIETLPRHYTGQETHESVKVRTRGCFCSVGLYVVSYNEI